MPRTKKIILVGDRILIRPSESKDRTKVGLYLPPNIEERDRVQSGYVVKTGPGYPLPDFDSIDSEPWAETRREAKFIPLQAEEGDYAIFLRKAAIEIEFENEKYLIVPHVAILALVRDDLEGLLGDDDDD